MVRRLLLVATNIVVFVVLAEAIAVVSYYVQHRALFYAADKTVPAALVETERGELYRQAQRLIAADVPYISLWYKTNVAVSQRDVAGVTLSPTAEFTFLKDVRRIPH